MTVGGMTIRPARVDEFGTVMDILGESIRWLRGRGLDQWSAWRTWRAKMAPALEQSQVWILREGGEAIGTITVEFSGDPDFWTPAELGEPAGYVSKLAVRRDWAGREIGSLLLEWAADHAWRRGCTWLRLDAWKTNQQLHGYYRDRGWVYLRTAGGVHRRSGALFQVPAAPMSLPAGQILEQAGTGRTVLTTRHVAGPGLDEAAGNWQPDHSHVGGLDVDYPDVGVRPALFLPFLRYRLRRRGHVWVLEAETGGVWGLHGAVQDQGWERRDYIISHEPWDVCRMVIVAGGGSQSYTSQGVE